MRITSSLEDEEKEDMPLERKKGASLHPLLTGRSKGSGLKDASGSKLPSFPPPPPAPLVNPFASTNLKKRKKDKEVVEEGELVPHNKGFPPKIFKMAKGMGRASSTESKDVENVADVCPISPTWNPRLELDGTMIPLNSSIKEFQRGNTHYVVDALGQPLLLSKDMAALKNVK